MILLALALAAAAVNTADIRAINVACRVPEGWLTLRSDTSFLLNTPVDADEPKLECILSRLKVLSEGNPALTSEATKSKARH